MARSLLLCSSLLSALVWLRHRQAGWVPPRWQASSGRPPGSCKRRNSPRAAAHFPAPRVKLAAFSAGTASPNSSAYWTWQGERVHYRASGPVDGKPFLLIHGFGLSGLNYRETSRALASEGCRVYALDLLGFGRSSKPASRTYGLELWEEQVVDFCRSYADKEQPWVLGGNSIGGIVAMGVASKFGIGTQTSAKAFGGVRGLVLFNCAAGSNNKLIITSYRTNWLEKSIGRLIFGLVDALLAQEAIARWGFEKLATKETVTDLLRKVYVNAEQVDDELTDDILAAAADDGALQVFVKCLSGDPGTPPEKLIDRVCCPVKMIWGDQDLLTPLGVGYGYFFRALDKLYPSQWSLSVVPAGHMPHDDAPEAVSAALIPWLASLPEEAATKPRDDFNVNEVLQLSLDADSFEKLDNSYLNR